MEHTVNLNLSEYLLLFQILGVYLGVEFQTHPIMNIKRNIIFALESRKKSGVPIVENVPIRMRVIYASQRIEFTTGYRIDVAKWDSDKQRVKNGCTNKLKQSASEINADLLKYYTEIQNVFKEFEVQETIEYFNEFGLNEYVNFLRDKKDMKNSTFGKQMGFLK